jgi:hypothetical protein
LDREPGRSEGAYRRVEPRQIRNPFGALNGPAEDTSDQALKTLPSLSDSWMKGHGALQGASRA